jgi:hypothetical protein
MLQGRRETEQSSQRSRKPQEQKDSSIQDESGHIDQDTGTDEERHRPLKREPSHTLSASFQIFAAERCVKQVEKWIGLRKFPQATKAINGVLDREETVSAFEKEKEKEKNEEEEEKRDERVFRKNKTKNRFDEEEDEDHEHDDEEEDHWEDDESDSDSNIIKTPSGCKYLSVFLKTKLLCDRYESISFITILASLSDHLLSGPPSCYGNWKSFTRALT